MVGIYGAGYGNESRSQSRFQGFKISFPYGLKKVGGKIMATKKRFAAKNVTGWKATIAVSMANYIEAGSIIAAASSLTLWQRSEEHTSELQSRFDIVCRL